MKYKKDSNYWAAVFSSAAYLSLLLWLLLGLSLNSSAEIYNFCIYTQYNNLAGEDTSTGPVTNTVTGTYTLPSLAIVKYSINRRVYPTQDFWSDTEIINAVPGDTIEYKVTWIQSGVGIPADTVALIDSLPTGVTFIDSQIMSGGGTITYSAPLLEWHNNNVSVSDTGEIRYRVRVNP